MARSLWLADVLADAYRGVSGVRFEVYPGWQTRGRDGVRHIGLMNHHTGPGGYDALLRYMATNSSIAPLCNIASSHDGSRVTLVAAGKANHAGRGHLDWTGTDRGNWYTLGWEAQNDGHQPWPDRHLETVAIGNAALRDHMAVDLSRLVDHKTYAPGRKVDRHTIQLDAWRRRVAATERQEIPVDAVILIDHTEGTPDAITGLQALFLRPDQKVGLVVNVDAAKAALREGKRVYAVGRAARLVDGDRDLAGANRLDTADKVLAQGKRGW